MKANRASVLVWIGIAMNAITMLANTLAAVVAGIVGHPGTAVTHGLGALSFGAVALFFFVKRRDIVARITGTWPR